MIGVATRGRPLTLVHATQVVVAAKRTRRLVGGINSKSFYRCPYTRGTHIWSVWSTAYNNHRASTDLILTSLIESGVKCNEVTMKCN